MVNNYVLRLRLTLNNASLHASRDVIRIASPPKSATLTRAREKSLAKCNYLWDFLLKFQKKFVSLHTETAKRSLDRALTAL